MPNAARRARRAPLAVLGMLAAGLAAAEPVRLAPGDSATVTLDAAGDARATLVLDGGVGGPLVVEARSRAVDVRVDVFGSADGGVAAAPLASDDNGLGGTDAAAAFDAAAGLTYRLVIAHADATEDAGGTVTVTVRAGTLTPRGEAAAAADDAYWRDVVAAGDTQGDPWLAVRGRAGLSALAFARGRYAAAVQEGRAAAERAERAWGPESARLGALLGNLGLALHWSGDLDGAADVLRRAVRVLERTTRDPDPRLAIALSALGSLLDDRGELAEARAAHERALALRERISGPESPDVIAQLGNYANLLDSEGDLERAEALDVRALAIAEKAWGGASTRLAVLLNNLAYVEKRLGRRDEAVALYERALALREAKLGADHPLTALSRQNLAVALHESGRDAARAETLLRQALALRETKLGPGHPDVAVTLQNLADVLRANGRAEEALPLLERGLEIRRERLGRAHPDTSRTEIRLAAVLAALGRGDAALALALDAEARARTVTRTVARHLPDRLALRYAGLRLSGLDPALAVLEAGAAPPERVRQVWDAVLRSRALVFDLTAERFAALHERETPAARSAGSALARAAERWARLASGGTDLRGDALKAALLEADAARDRAEARLATLSAGFRRELEFDRVRLADVLRVLPAHTALVAYVRYERGAAGPERSAYGAFVAAPGAPPCFVRLAAAEDLDRRVAAWRTAVGGLTGDVELDRQREARARDAGLALRQAAWDPVAVRLAGVDRVVVVPEGTLHLVSFDALPGAGETYLVESAPAFEYASAERDLLRRAPRGAPHGPLTAFGAPTYDAALGAADAHGAAAPARGAGSPCGTAALRFAPLPAAELEATEVAGLAGGAARVLTGAAATESAFKALAPTSGALHLATHGFVTAGSCAVAPGSALKLSGLALAGANRHGTAAEEDGILTAEEIAALDLSRVDWVALSACDTGTGGLAAGEGVLGLRRAFAIAGARTLVIALWPVDDRDARRWMIEAYRAHFAGGERPAAAARHAARALLAERRARKLDTGPAHWGGFVAVGR